jgi:hypothetical protein
MTVERRSVREGLLATAVAYRRVHEEHRRAGPEGRARRHLEARLEELTAEFEHLLAAAAIDAVGRERWRRHLYDGAAEPALPAAEPVPAASRHRPRQGRGRGSAPLWQR